MLNQFQALVCFSGLLFVRWAALPGSGSGSPLIAGRKENVYKLRHDPSFVELLLDWIQVVAGMDGCNKIQQAHRPDLRKLGVLLGPNLDHGGLLIVLGRLQDRIARKEGLVKTLIDVVVVQCCGSCCLPRLH